MDELCFRVFPACSVGNEKRHEMLRRRVVFQRERRIVLPVEQALAVARLEPVTDPSGEGIDGSSRLRIDTATASGFVTFPIVFEGPPGLVHGGFLGVLFDCVTQHHNCAVGRSGKTRSMTVRYRRPTPLETELRFEIVRAHADREITSTATLLLDGEVLCTGEVSALALPPERLSPQRFALRRES